MRQPPGGGGEVRTGWRQGSASSATSWIWAGGSEMIDAGLVWRGTARAEDAQGTPTQRHISPNILVDEENSAHIRQSGPDSSPGCQVRILAVF